MSEVYQIVTDAITCHAWNKDRTQIALCPNNNEVHVFKKEAGQFKLVQVLREHEKLVTGIDWAPNSNRLVTCSQDRNAYVWNLVGNEWQPTLVILRINRAATFVKWSPAENKFAVASGARCISICNFEKDNDWWVSKHIRKPIRSTILSLDWHPNNCVIVAGAADFKVRLFSAIIPEIDPTPSDNAWGSASFGEMMAEFGRPAIGWVHSVAFSPSGNAIAWVGHDASLNVVYADKRNNVQTVLGKHLPLRCVIFTSEASIVGAGYDNVPLMFTCDASRNWAYSSKLDQNRRESASTGATAMNMFKQMDSRNQADAVDKLDSVHQNAVTCIAVVARTGQNISKLSTSGVDGTLAIWDVRSVEGQMAGLKVR